MNVQRARAIPLLLTTILVATPVLGGVVYEVEVTDHRQSPPTERSMQAAVEGRNLSMGMATEGADVQGTMIYRGDRDEVVTVDHTRKTYMVFDRQAVQQMTAQISQAMSQMQEALKNVPESQRAQIEEMMKQRMPSQAAPRPRSELRRTGEQAEKHGYPCVKYEVLLEGRKIRELWVTDWGNIEGGSEVVAVFEDMAEFFRELLDAVPQFASGPSARVEFDTFEHMKELGGYPVVTREFGEDGSLENESALRSAERQSLDPDAFEPPSGYKRQEMFPRR